MGKLKQWLFPEQSYKYSKSHLSNHNLLTIRFASLIVLTGVYGLSMAYNESLLNYVIYLTSIGQFFAWLFFLLAVQGHFLGDKLSEKGDSLTFSNVG